MVENTFFNKYGIDVKFEFEDDIQDISTIIAEAFEKYVEKEINKN